VSPKGCYPKKNGRVKGDGGVCPRKGGRWQFWEITKGGNAQVLRAATVLCQRKESCRLSEKKKNKEEGGNIEWRHTERGEKSGREYILTEHEIGSGIFWSHKEG